MRDQIKAALEDAVRDDDKLKITTLRLIKTAIKDRDHASQIDGGERVSDEDVTAILIKMIRQRFESTANYEIDGRLDLAQQERDEIAVIDRLLPEQLDEDQLRSVCAEAIQKTGAAGLRDVGRCMQALKSRYRGRMDFTKAGAVVRGMLR